MNTLYYGDNLDVLRSPKALSYAPEPTAPTVYG